MPYCGRQSLHLRTILILVILVFPCRFHAADPDTQDPVTKQSHALLGHLGQAVTWYQHTKGRVQPSGLPTDVVFQNNTQALAAKALTFAFQSAKGQAALLDTQPNKAAVSSEGSASQSNLVQLRARVLDRTVEIKQQIAALQAPQPRSAKREEIRAQIEELQGELALAGEMTKTFDQLQSFIAENGSSGANGIGGAIDKLERSVPDLATANTSTADTSKSPDAGATSSGLIGQVVSLYQKSQTLHQIQSLMTETEQVKKSSQLLQAPLIDALRRTVRDSGLLSIAQLPAGASQSNPAIPTAAMPNQGQNRSRAEVARFQKISQASVPLTQELLILDQCTANLNEWQATVRRSYTQSLRSLLGLVVTLAIALGVVGLISGVARWLIFRYVHEIRRRRQLLLIRRIVTSFLVILVLGLGFVSEFSSLATFDCFITSGIAVGLQTLLLSVAAYFFILGRYGIRVGDRVTVAGVTGDVVDVGLVRFYLKELAGIGVDLYATGRLVAISNSVLFQAAAPLYKQLPGADYAWHEVAVTLQPGGDLALVERELSASIDRVFASYSKEIETQHSRMRNRSEIILAMPQPHLQLQFAEAGLEAVVRYPIPLDRISQVDQSVTREVVTLIEGNEKIRQAVVGLPRIRAALKS